MQTGSELRRGAFTVTHVGSHYDGGWTSAGIFVIDFQPHLDAAAEQLADYTARELRVFPRRHTEGVTEGKAGEGHRGEAVDAENPAYS